jgi:hypothetical protein
MKITAPDKWLDDVDVVALRQWFLARGWRPGWGSCWLNGPNDQQVILPENLREFGDWKHRLLEAIEQAATLEGITAAEWFERQRIGKRSG